MSNFLASFFITCLVLVLFVGGLRYCSLQGQVGNTYGIELVNRQRAVIPVRQQDVDSGFPFATEVRLIFETEDKMVCEVDYYVQPKDTLKYSLSLYPNKTDFYNEKNILRSGKNTQRVTIYYNSKSILRRQDRTTYLNLSIHENVEGSYVGVLYKRKILVDKIWRKTRQYVPALNPAENKTN